MAAESGEHLELYYIFTPVWEHLNESPPEWFKWFEFDHPKYGQIWFECICFSIVVAIGLAIFSIFASRKTTQNPHGVQNFLEMCIEGLSKLYMGILGPGGEKYVPYLASLFIYIVCMNAIGLIPFFRSPTSTVSVTFGLGLVTFCYVQISAIRANGFLGYIKHLAGPVVALSWLMIPLEIVGELIKPCSLSLRLYGNISGEDTVIEKIWFELGHGMPFHVPFVFLAVFTSFLQAFIFTALTSVYISILTAHEEEHSEAHEGAHGH